VEVLDIKRGRVLVIGDVDPNKLVEKLKNINKNAEICGSMYNILAHEEESSRSNLPGNRSGQRGGRGFLRWLFGKKSNRSNNEDDIDIHNYPSSDNNGNGNGNSGSETLELHSNTSDDHGISHHHGYDNAGHGSGVGQTIPTGNYNPLNNQEGPFMYHYGQGMQMQPLWPAMNQQHQQQEEAYNNNQGYPYLNIFGGFPNHDEYMKMQQQQLGNQQHQQQDAYNNMNHVYPPTMTYGEPSSSMNYTTPPPMQHDSNLVDPKPVYNDGYVYNWWTEYQL